MTPPYLAPLCKLATDRPREFGDEHIRCVGNVAYYQKNHRSPLFHDRCDCECHQGQTMRDVILD